MPYVTPAPGQHIPRAHTFFHSPLLIATSFLPPGDCCWTHILRFRVLCRIGCNIVPYTRSINHDKIQRGFTLSHSSTGGRPYRTYSAAAVPGRMVLTLVHTAVPTERTCVHMFPVTHNKRRYHVSCSIITEPHAVTHSSQPVLYSGNTFYSMLLPPTVH